MSPPSHLTRCSSCRAHVHLGTTLDGCPHCGHTGSPRVRLGSTGRAGLVAAALMAFSATACGGGAAEPDNDTGSDTAGSDTAGSDDSGDGAGDDTQPGDDAGDDTGIADGGDEPGDGDADSPPPERREPERGTVHALYGVPPG